METVWATMEAQARENPAVALLHERLEGTIRLIGLTGGIACGKSTVASFFKEAKIPVIDADQIARAVVKKGTQAYRQIIQSFGEGILDEKRTIDREGLGRIVFADAAKRQLLESITHPEIFRKIAEKVKSFKKRKKRAVIVDAALLFETGLHRQMHKNILVKIHPDVQQQRLIQRDGLSETEAWRRILSQMPTAEKEKLADFVVDNSGSLEETRLAVASILNQWK